MNSFSIINKELSDFIINNKQDLSNLKEFIRSCKPNIDEDFLEEVNLHIKRNFMRTFKAKWNEAHRMTARFLSNNVAWLEKTLFIQPKAGMSASSTQRSSAGRPEKAFTQCCDRAKIYKVKQLIHQYPAEQIEMAAKKIYEDTAEHKKLLSNEMALRMFLDAHLTKNQYDIIRNTCKDAGFDIFPSYYKLIEEKKKSYPKSIQISEKGGKVELQSLLDHTAQRICETKSEEEITQLENGSLILITKWGCDGSSGQSEYKQRFFNNNQEDFETDAFMFMVSLVPLVLTSSDKCVKHWENPKPSSTRYCRPLSFEYAKETPTKVMDTVKDIEEKISRLSKSVVSVYGKEIKVKHELLFTMIDGKVAQIVTQTKSSTSCFICKATPKEMNNLNIVKNKAPTETAFRLGMSPLHARIKFMECILHIGYNLSFQQWAATKEFKTQKEETKKKIQEEFQKRLGLRVDKVSQGSGNSNDGNTSRRFFANPEIASEITGVNLELIRRFAIILEVITSGLEINAQRFGQYAFDTAKCFVAKYNWYYMPVTIHKILLHGENIISAAVLPIGILSEEAQEGRNKDYKRYRLFHSRKCSREATNEDIMHMMMLTSDPYISNLRKTYPKPHKILSDEVEALLIV